MTGTRVALETPDMDLTLKNLRIDLTPDRSINFTFHLCPKSTSLLPSHSTLKHRKAECIWNLRMSRSHLVHTRHGTALRWSTGFCSAAVHSNADNFISFSNSKGNFPPSILPQQPTLSASSLSYLFVCDTPKLYLVPLSHWQPTAPLLTCVFYFSCLALRYKIMAIKTYANMIKFGIQGVLFSKKGKNPRTSFYSPVNRIVTVKSTLKQKKFTHTTDCTHRLIVVQRLFCRLLYFFVQAILVNCTGGHSKKN